MSHVSSSYQWNGEENDGSFLAKAVRQEVTFSTSLSPCTGRRAFQGLGCVWGGGGGTLTKGKEPGSLNHCMEEAAPCPIAATTAIGAIVLNY